MGWGPRGGRTGAREPRFAESVVAMRRQGWGYRETGGLMEVPFDNGGGNGPRAAGPDRRMDMVDPRGRGDTKSRSEGSPG